jgi:molybdopterin molybdotransferase
VSVGDHDLVKPALEAAGVTIDLWRVAIKPGKPLVVGRKPGGARDKVVLGVPGNPSSAMVTFALFGVPLLRALQGDRRPFPASSRARMTRALAHEPGRREFARASLTPSDDGLLVTPLGNQASGAPTSMAEADALVCIPEDRGNVAAGEEVEVLLLEGLAG